MTLERATKEGKSPVNENDFTLLDVFLKYHGAITLWETSLTIELRLNTQPYQ